MAFSIKTTRNFHHQNSPAKSDLQRQAVLHSFNQKEERAQKLLAHTNSFAVLPLYKTPPSAFKTERPFNPFNRNLMERLESSTFSPTVFENVISPREVSTNEFRWTIEDVSRFTPARIEETSVTHDDIDTVDNETEQSAQEAIERYFAKVEIPSPWNWEAPKHCSSPLTETPEVAYKSTKTVTTPSNSVNSFGTHCRRRPSLGLTCNVGTQTCWSFPLVLPDEIEAMLKPYLQPISSECEIDEECLSTSSLRRKLNFSKVNHSSDRSDDENMSCDRFSVDGGFSSPVSHFRAVTPLPMMSPPDVSPIVKTENKMPSKLTTRLNFTNIHCGTKINEDDERDHEKISNNVTPIKCSENSVYCTRGIKNRDSDYNNCSKMDDRTDDIEHISHDTGYQTQGSNDKTSWGGMTAASEIMEITDSANASWADPL